MGGRAVLGVRESGRKGVADVAHQLLLAAGESLGIKIDFLIGHGAQSFGAFAGEGRARAAHGRGVFRAKQVGKGTPDVLDHINSPFLPLRRVVYTSTNSMPSRRHSRRTRAA